MNDNKKHVFQKYTGLLILGIVVILLFGGIYSIYTMVENYSKPYVVPGVLLSNKPTTPTFSMPTAKQNRSRVIGYTAPSGHSNTMFEMPGLAMTSTSAKLYESSNAAVRHIGSSNGMANGNAAILQSNNSRRGKSDLAYGGGAIYVSAPHNFVTAVGAPNASEMANTVTQGGNDRPGARKVDGFPEIPFPDPIGDALLPLALLACAYAFLMYARKRMKLKTNK